MQSPVRGMRISRVADGVTVVLSSRFLPQFSRPAGVA